MATSMRTSISVILCFACLYASVVEAKPPVEAVKPVDSARMAQVRDARYVVKIDRLKVSDGGVFDTLDVVLDSYGIPIGGFDLKIAADSPYLEIMEVLKGEIPEELKILLEQSF